MIASMWARAWGPAPKTTRVSQSGLAIMRSATMLTAVVRITVSAAASMITVGASDTGSKTTCTPLMRGSGRSASWWMVTILTVGVPVTRLGMSSSSPGGRSTKMRAGSGSPRRPARSATSSASAH
jgi:hypothetical protein